MVAKDDKTMGIRKWIGRRTACYFFSIVFGCLFVKVYVTYFRHPPPDVLLRMQQKQVQELPVAAVGLGIKEVVDLKLPKPGELEWQDFIKENNYVSIGQVFDNCEGHERKTVGTVIMQPDTETGGVMTRTFMNLTLEKEITDGQVFLEVKYNGRDLYDNSWDLCTIDEDEERRQIFCPIQIGFHHYFSDKKIPSYLPKGKYETKAWSTDQDKEIINCGISVFVL